MEESKSIFKLDGPIGRLKYFGINMLILLVLCLAQHFIDFKESVKVQVYTSIAIIILTPILFYIAILADMKRCWDILENKKRGIIIGSIVFILPIIYTPLSVLYLILLFIPGKYIKSKQLM